MRGIRAGVIANGLVFIIMIAGASAAAQTESKAAASGEPFTGKQLYSSYCALCHGSDGKGGGPFSPQLKVWPPDLTQMAKKNNGVFPSMRVSEAIDGEFGKPSHGSAEMPIWGPLFSSISQGHEAQVQQRTTNLVTYIETLQAK